jgi:hypothetical protein
MDDTGRRCHFGCALAEFRAGNSAFAGCWQDSGGLARLSISSIRLTFCCGGEPLASTHVLCAVLRRSVRGSSSWQHYLLHWLDNRPPRLAYGIAASTLWSGRRLHCGGFGRRAHGLAILPHAGVFEGLVLVLHWITPLPGSGAASSRSYSSITGCGRSNCASPRIDANSYRLRWSANPFLTDMSLANHAHRGVGLGGLGRPQQVIGVATLWFNLTSCSNPAFRSVDRG